MKAKFLLPKSTDLWKQNDDDKVVATTALDMWKLFPRQYKDKPIYSIDSSMIA
jgi:hypothetical protein